MKCKKCKKDMVIIDSWCNNGLGTPSEEFGTIEARFACTNCLTYKDIHLKEGD